MDNTTLRELVGLSNTPVPLTDSTLILIDCQNTYTTGVMELDGVQAALDEAAGLLERARSLGIPIVHIMHNAGAGSPYDVDAEIGQIVDRVAPLEGEPVFVKAYPNAFTETGLHEHLSSAPGRDILLAGFMTHMCVNSAARGAFSLGYRPTVVAKATATRSLPGPDGTVSASALQVASLASISDLFGVVVAGSSDVPD